MTNNLNYGMPSPDEFVFKLGKIKKTYYDWEVKSTYNNRYRIIALEDRTFAVEAGGGIGYYIVKTWNEAVSMRNLFISRHRNIGRLFDE